MSSYGSRFSYSMNLSTRIRTSDYYLAGYALGWDTGTGIDT